MGVPMIVGAVVAFALHGQPDLDIFLGAYTATATCHILGGTA